ncbi:MAG: hypothetical protein WAN44_03585 [Propionibacteriaceae bacterium]
MRPPRRRAVARQAWSAFRVLVPAERRAHVCDNFSIFAATAAHLLSLGLPLEGIRVMPSTRSPFPDQPTIALDHQRTVDTVSNYS